MTGDSIECFNCGRQNPGWAQICRQCGVRLDPALAAGRRPGGLFPTDQRSLIALAAALGTIVLGVLLALFISGLDPFDPTAVRESPSPEVDPVQSGSFGAEPVPSGSALAEPAASEPVAEPPAGTIEFGTGLDANQGVTGATDVFAPSDNFAHSLSMPEPFGVSAVDGTEEEVIAAAENQLSVDPEATVRGAVCCQASELVSQLGPGQFILRAYIGETLIAEGQFQFSEG
jgi:hypothetical protein